MPLPILAEAPAQLHTPALTSVGQVLARYIPTGSETCQTRSWVRFLATACARPWVRTASSAGQAFKELGPSRG